MACAESAANQCNDFLVQVPAANVLCIGWSSDGGQLALGQTDGGIALRDAGGVPLGLLDAMPDIPVTLLAWGPARCSSCTQLDALQFTL